MRAAIKAMVFNYLRKKTLHFNATHCNEMQRRRGIAINVAMDQIKAARTAFDLKTTATEVTAPISETGETRLTRLGG